MHILNVSEERAKDIEKLRRGYESLRKITQAADQEAMQIYEQKAIKQFEEKFRIKNQKCGLFVPVDRPYLGASPDAIVGDDGIVEVRCLYAGRNMPILPGPKFRHLQLDSNNQICFKKSSLCYDQIQGQLFLSNRKFCFFVVYTFQDSFVQKIYIDREYCIGCLIPTLEHFLCEILSTNCCFNASVKI